MTSSTASDDTALHPRLVTVAGPTRVALGLVPPGPYTIGRRADHDLDLADKHVSRNHATLTYRTAGKGASGAPGHWFVTDEGSKHGTWVNGLRLESGQETRLGEGDYLILGPWTFRVVRGESDTVAGQRVSTVDDTISAGTIVSRLDARETESLERRKLALLLEFAEAIHAAQDEQGLAEAVLDAAVAGTGFTNAAVARPVTEDGRTDVIAHRGAVLGDGTTPRLSRSLIHEASAGSPARLARRSDPPDQAMSIVALSIEEALCVPILLGSAVAGVLYLDVRAGGASPAGRAGDAGGFAIGLARLAAMAWANLMRVDMERRQARMEAELNAAAESQRYLMPPREAHVGPFGYVGECRPARDVGGDFFDVIPLEGNRLAVALGDVTGKGVPASVLMTASKGFLYAALSEHGDPGRAVTELNRFLEPRCQDDRFLTLWVGVLDGEARTLSYVDGGHGYAMIVAGDGQLDRLNASTAPLVGVLPGAEYETTTMPLPDAGRLLVVSDGIIEQSPAGGMPADQFAMTGIETCLRSLPPDEDAIIALFDAVERFAGTAALADDATAVMVRW